MEERKRICFRVSHPYKVREGPPVFSPSTCTVSSFSSQPDENFKSYRHLHEKGVQTEVAFKSKNVQSHLFIPCNKWTQVQAAVSEELPEDLKLSEDIVKEMEMMLEEKNAVDPLLDEWGMLSKNDQANQAKP